MQWVCTAGLLYIIHHGLSSNNMCCSFLYTALMALMVTKKHVTFTRRQYKLTIRFNSTYKLPLAVMLQRVLTLKGEPGPLWPP